MRFEKFKELDLPGVRILPLDRYVDERGFFVEVLRSDWKDFFGDDTIVQVNYSMIHPRIVKAWHRHLKGQVDYFLVLKGMLKICVYDEESGKLGEIISSEDKLQLVRVPGHYWHGVKSVGNEPVLYVYFVNKLYDYNNPDEDRRPWNDPKIIPKSINGKKDDPRCDKPWDWFYPPYK